MAMLPEFEVPDSFIVPTAMVFTYRAGGGKPKHEAAERRSQKGYFTMFSRRFRKTVGTARGNGG